MGVFTRPDSPWYWLYLETAPLRQRKEKTAVKVGTTAEQRRDNRRLAEQVYHQRMTELAAKIHRLPLEHPAFRFRELATQYARDVVPQHRGADREREILQTLTAAFGDTLLSSLDRERVQAWIALRRGDVAARTVNREVDVLKSVLKTAVPKYLEASPLVGLRKLTVVPPTRRLLTPAEERKILPKLKRDDRAIFLIGLDTLCRLGDILDLRWEDDRGTVLYIRDPKDPIQGRPYVVPVSARIRKALDALPKSGAYIFPRRRRGATAHNRGASIRLALKTACEAVNVPYGRTKGGITFHWATRRTGATRMLQRGAEIKAVQQIGNWKRPAVMLDIYAEASSTAAKQAVELVSHSRPVPARRRKA